MKYGIEELSPELSLQIEGMFRDYYASTPAHVGQPPYEFAWYIYYRLSLDRNLLIITARDDDKLCGVNMYILMEHPHHTGLLVAECDSLATVPAYRGQGIGRALVELGEKILRNMGIQRVIHHYRTVYEVDEPLFPKLGFTLIQQSYSKDL